MVKPGLDEFIKVVSTGANIKPGVELTSQSVLANHGISSMDTIHLVNEIDKKYGVILEFDDLDKADTITDLYHILLSKLK